jgi:hypothetical protein
MLAPRPRSRGHTPGTPSYGGGSLQAGESFGLDAPSVHFAEQQPEPEPELSQPSQPTTAAAAAVTDAAQGTVGGTQQGGQIKGGWNPLGSMPKITKKAIHLGDGTILFRSPRCKQALLETGVDKSQLLAQPRDNFVIGAKLPAVVEKRWEANEKRRRKNLGVLLRRRQELVAQSEDERAGGGAAEAARRAAAQESATMLRREAEHKARIIESAKLRFQEEQRAAVAAERRKQESDQTQRELQEKLEARRVQREESFDERRKVCSAYPSVVMTMTMMADGAVAEVRSGLCGCPAGGGEGASAPRAAGRGEGAGADRGGAQA